MSERTPGSGDEAMDLEILARDDVLLDALGRGEDAPAGDDLAVMLAAWHADIADGAPEPAVVRHPTPTGTGPVSDPPVPLRPARRRRSVTSRPWALRLAAAVVALVALASGLGVGSRNAGPDSPLWSLTRLLYPQQAEVREVEETIARARVALAAGRLDEAQQLIDRARGALDGITDAAAAARLRAELDALAVELASARARSAPTAVPSVSPTPGVERTSSTPRPNSGTAAPKPPPAQPNPSSSPTGESGPLLPLPSLPLPPPPSPSLLSPLPGLPLPTGGLLD